MDISTTGASLGGDVGQQAVNPGNNLFAGPNVFMDVSCINSSDVLKA